MAIAESLMGEKTEKGIHMQNLILEASATPLTRFSYFIIDPFIGSLSKYSRPEDVALI